MSKNFVENTSKNFNIGWLFGGNPSAIENQEKEGQNQFVESDILPNCDDATKTKLESMGVIFKNPVEDDPLFWEVVLPVGWKTVSTDYSVWSNLLNEKGEKVASIFYKAAFYDRDAFINVVK